MTTATVVIGSEQPPPLPQQFKAKLFFYVVHSATAREYMKGFKTAFSKLSHVIFLGVGQIKAFHGQII